MASSLSKAAQWARARYGAGMIPGRSVNSAKSSGEHLKESRTGAGSSGITANILPPTLNTKSSSHCTVSVTCGKDRQQLRTKSTFMDYRAALRSATAGAERLATLGKKLLD